MKIFSGYIFSSKASETPENVIVSKPPEGYKQVTGIYIEPQTGAVIVIYNTD